MREKFFTAAESGLTRAQLRWGERQGRWTRVLRDVYWRGPEPPTKLAIALAVAVATSGVASGSLAGTLLGLDGVRLRGPDVTTHATTSTKRSRVRRRTLPPERVVEVMGFGCTDGLQTLLDLAADLSPNEWEQALESALRNGLTTIRAIEDALPMMGRARTAGVTLMRGVLAKRPPGAAPTGSILETFAVQLIREAGLPDPQRQVRVENEHGRLVAYVDLAWPELGIFLELDGQQHLGQPVYDAMRQTDVSGATGWLVGRFTWDEVVRHPVVTRRRLVTLIEQGRRQQAAA